jgi:hypothetical protein
MQPHRNSRSITIFRAGSFLSRAQGKEIDDFFANSKRSIGSYWESVSSKRIASGMTFEEEEVLLPLVIDCTAEDREFRKKVALFYGDIDTQVPYNGGVTLEIGLKLDNTKPLHKDKDPEKSNLPLEVMDYIRWRHAIKHPQVAPTKEAADGNPMAEFYLFDKSDTIKKNTKKSDEKDAAMEIFLAIKAVPEKIDMMLTLLGIDPREFTGKDADALKLEALRKVAEDKAEQFTTIYQGENLEVRSWIKTMINTGVLKVIGDKYYDKETNKLLANSLEEFTVYFLDDDNSDMVTTLKARMQEAKKKPIDKTLSGPKL